MLSTLVRGLKGPAGRSCYSRGGVAGLAAASVVVTALNAQTDEIVQEEEQEGQHPTPTTTLLDRGWTTTTTLNNSIIARPGVVVQCDAAAYLLNAPPTPRRLRRLATVRKLEETAAEDRLEAMYRVDLEQPLGEGAFGVVYAGQHRTTGEHVAVKKISKRYTSGSAFQREMEALMLLRDSGGHPNIAGMHENFDEGDYFYIVFDLVNGCELFDQLCAAGPYSERDAARHIQEVAGALAFLHGIGVIHSDLKPENLMLSSQKAQDAVLKLVDLGCAHLQTNSPLTDKRQKGATISTPAYSPPEVLVAAQKTKNVKIEPSFDMWSLGVVIYIMLVGVHPFDVDSRASNEEIEESIISGKGFSLRDCSLTEHLSEDAISLIEGLLERDPQKRLTAEQVLENPWVRGETASFQKIADSDKRLAQYRKYKTRIGSTFFKTLLSQTDAIHRRRTTERISVLESAFRRLDTEQNGYLSTKEIRGTEDDDSTEESGEDAKLTFSDISSLLAENMKHRYFGKGHVVYKQGDSGDSMFLVNSGTVEVTTKDGFKKVREPGELFGEGAMTNDKKRHSTTVRCVTPVHVLEISRELFEKYVASDPETFLNMAERDRHRRRERASTILRFNEACRQHSYDRGEVIFRKGDTGGDLYLLEDGEIEITVGGHKVRSLQQGEMTGEHAAYFGKPYNVSAKCVSDSCLVKALTASDMHNLFRSDPSLRQDFRDLLLRRDFKKALCMATSRSFPTTEQEIKASFDAIDKKRSGEIAFDQLRAIVQRFDPSYKDDDIRDMLISLDLNRSGSLTWNEFHRIFSMDKEA